MTLVAVMDFGNYFLIGAETKVGQQRLVSRATKLESLDSVPIAWGCAGDLGIASEFSHWLHRYEWKNDIDWHKFRDDVATELGRLNREYRFFVKWSDAKPEEGARTSVIVAGYINGCPEILEVTGEGERFFHMQMQSRFVATGSGEDHIRIIKATIDALNKPITDDVFWWMLNLAVSLDPKSGPPIDGFKVMQQGISKVKT